MGPSGGQKHLLVCFALSQEAYATLDYLDSQSLSSKLSPVFFDQVPTGQQSASSRIQLTTSHPQFIARVHSYELQTDLKVSVAIMGMGKLAATRMGDWLGAHVVATHCINLGIGLALADELNFGDMLTLGLLIAADMDSPRPLSLTKSPSLAKNKTYKTLELDQECWENLQSKPKLVVPFANKEEALGITSDVIIRLPENTAWARQKAQLYNACVLDMEAHSFFNAFLGHSPDTKCACVKYVWDSIRQGSYRPRFVRDIKIASQQLKDILIAYLTSIGHIKNI